MSMIENMQAQIRHSKEREAELRGFEKAREMFLSYIQARTYMIREVRERMRKDIKSMRPDGK